MDLFNATLKSEFEPLAEKLRPGSMEQLLWDDGGELSRVFTTWEKGKNPQSLMVSGPAGSGKTSFLRILFDLWKGPREDVNAVDVGIPKLREVIKKAADHYASQGVPTVLFVDEVHRLRAPQQDILLPGLENGSVLLLAATTENPLFHFNRAFLSRLQMLELRPLSKRSLQKLTTRGLESLGFTEKLPTDLEEKLILRSGGDGRKLLGDLSAIFSLYSDSSGLDDKAALKHLSLNQNVGSKNLKVEALSALIKTMRASDEKAAVYYMGLLLHAKEDPQVMLRRMVIFASEDIGNANPQAVILINATWEGFLKVGMPEGEYSLYQACSYLAKSPKSRRHVEQKTWADQNIGNQISFSDIPDHLKSGHSGAVAKAPNLPKHLSGK